MLQSLSEILLIRLIPGVVCKIKQIGSIFLEQSLCPRENCSLRHQTGNLVHYLQVANPYRTGLFLKLHLKGLTSTLCIKND